MTTIELKEIMPSGYVQWDIYRVIREAWSRYRGIEITTKEITKADFMKNMQFDLYVRIDGTENGKPVIIVILDSSDSGASEIAGTTEKFKLFINSIRSGSPKAEIMLISAKRFQSHVVAWIIENELEPVITRINYSCFKVVYPRMPWVGRFKVLTSEESKKILEHFGQGSSDLKKILTDDPAVIWSGAKSGQIIEIEQDSLRAGIATDYRKVAKIMTL